MARKVPAAAQLHGTLVGVVAAIVSAGIALAFGGLLDVATLVSLILAIAAGWLGGTLGRRGQNNA